MFGRLPPPSCYGRNRFGRKTRGWRPRQRNVVRDFWSLWRSLWCSNRGMVWRGKGQFSISATYQKKRKVSLTNYPIQQRFWRGLGNSWGGRERMAILIPKYVVIFGNWEHWVNQPGWGVHVAERKNLTFWHCEKFILSPGPKASEDFLDSDHFHLRVRCTNQDVIIK